VGKGIALQFKNAYPENYKSYFSMIQYKLENWSNRKKTMFSNDKFIEKIISKLKLAKLI